MKKVSLIKFLFFSNFIFLIGHIDGWFELTGRFSLTSHGQIHLILDYERLRV